MAKTNKYQDEYCKDKGYSNFNKYNENDYTKWLESKLETTKPVNVDLADVSESLAELIEWSYNNCNSSNNDELYKIIDRLNVH
jgi:hypothetical protein